MTKRYCACGSGPLRWNNKNNQCTPCYHGRTCVTCPTKIRGENKSGRCHSCNARFMTTDPVASAHRRIGFNRHMAQPGVLESRASQIRENKRANPQAFKDGADKGRTKINAAASWCPREYIPLSRKLYLAGYSLAERKRIVAEEVAKAERARIAGMTKFERMMERVKNGERLVEKPVYRREHEYSLTGCSAALL